MSTTSDPSLRFVLPDDSPFLANLAALWAHEPKLAAAIEALDAIPSYRVEPSRSGVPTLAIPTDDGKSIHLHSRYQPLDDAKRVQHHAPQKQVKAEGKYGAERQKYDHLVKEVIPHLLFHELPSRPGVRHRRPLRRAG